MRKYLCTLYFIILLVLPLMAQQNVDSLFDLLDQTKEDTVRLRLLIDITNQLRMSDPDSAIYYAIQIRELAEELHDQSGLARAHYFIGVIYHNLGFLSSAINNLNASREIYEDLDDSFGLAGVYNAFGNLYQGADEDKALDYYNQSLEIFQDLGVDKYLPHIYVNMAYSYDKKKKYAEGQKYYFKALELLRETGDSTRILISAILNIGEHYELINDLDSAYLYYHHGLKLSKKLQNNPRLVDSYIHFGKYYNLTGDYDQSISYLDSAYAIATAQNFLPILKVNTELLADSYKKRGDYESALHYTELFIMLNDSLNLMEANKNLRDLELVAVHNQEMREKEADLQKQKLFQIFTMVALLLVMISLFYMYRNYRIKHKANALLAEVDVLKTRMFSNISHELRNPLTLILDPIEQMLDDEQHKRPSSKTLKLMERNVKRMLSLINQLLDLSKLDAGKLKIELSQGDVIHHLKIIALSFTSLAEKKNIHYTINCPDEETVTYFDVDKMDKILTNLIGNALKYTDDGGTVSVNVETDIGGARKRKYSEGQEILQIEVRDTGNGIPEDELTKIFNRFYQVGGKDEPEKVGTGIGLSLTKELIDLLKGDIRVESKVNLGTRFNLSIPLGTSHLEAADYVIVEEQEIPEKSTEEPVRSDKKDQPSQVGDDRQIILTVEDNEDIRTHITDHLAEYHVMEAADGAEGLNIATEQLPDLVITDLMMPKMDGVELCEKLKTDERTSHIPVIMLTAKTSVEDRIEGLETGADDYLTKPFNIKELRVRVKNLIEQRQKLRERFRKELMLEPREIAVTSADERFITQSLEIIEKNLSDQDFNVEQFGSELAMSRMQLFRKIKALTDQSPSEYIRTIRLKRAAQLIKSNYGNLAEITYEVGFNNPSYFAKCFRELYGVAPSEYTKTQLP